MMTQFEIPERITSNCAICWNNSLDIFTVREMQIGLREVFEYGRCSRCGAITRLSKITQLSKFYPPHYYSFNQVQKTQTEKTGIKGWVRNRRDRVLFTRSVDPIGQFLGWVSGETTILYRIVGKCQIIPESRVLDVGCGSGRLLSRMAEIGFQNLLGVDLFLPGNITLDGENLRIMRGNLSSIQGQNFDLIMMHHLIEHCDDQATQLKLARDLLAPRGLLLIRTPLCSSEAFRRYGANWFQLDAPRHVVLHSLASMKLLVQECGLRIKTIVWDSTDQQFWASEQYANDMAMYAEESYFCNPEGSQFTAQQIFRWKREAARLNRSYLGDQAAFFIEPG